MISNRSEALEAVRFLRNQFNRYSRLRVGLVGSFARGENNANSDIDILVDTYDMSGIKRGLLRNRIEELLECNYQDSTFDVVMLKDIESNDIHLDELSNKLFGEANMNSAYKNMEEEVAWCE